MPNTQTTDPHFAELARQEPDLLDRIFDYLQEELPELSPELAQSIQQRVRHAHGGHENYVRKSEPRPPMTPAVLALFNGRNATEVARRLGISRATVYRCIKQAGRGG